MGMSCVVYDRKHRSGRMWS